MTIKALIARLGQNIDAIANHTLALAADTLADDIRAALSTRPGGPHDHPWLQKGTLHNSIHANADGAQAIVASTSETALYQEHGTSTIPPRPTFAPLAAAHAPAIAQQIAQAVTQAIRGA